MVTSFEVSLLNSAIRVGEFHSFGLIRTSIEEFGTDSGMTDSSIESGDFDVTAGEGVT